MTGVLNEPRLLVAFLLILCVVSAFYAGKKYSNKRLVWVAADFMWLLMGMVTLIGFFLNLSDIRNELHAQSAKRIVLHTRQSLYRDIWAANDKYCTNQKISLSQIPRKREVQELCNWLPKLEREVNAPLFDHISSGRLANEMSAFFKNDVLHPDLYADMRVLHAKLTAYSKYYLENKAIIVRDTYFELLNRVNIIEIVICVWILAFAFRLGRTIAEFTRELKNESAVLEVFEADE